MPRLTALLFLSLAACSTAYPETSESASSTGNADSGTSAPPTTSLEPPPETTDATGTSGPATTTLEETTGPGMAADYAEPGGAPVGNATFTLAYGDRSLLVEVWYPADAAAKADADAGEPISAFVPPGPDRDAFDALLVMPSPAGMVGTRLQTRSARDAASSGMSSYPLVVFSHCHNCVRFSAFSLAEHLASRGFVVAAPDHAGNTLFDELAGQSAEVGEEFLQVRVADMRALVDVLLDPADTSVPAAIRGSVDPTRLGAMGHSFGAGTVGRLAQEDDRIVAALPLAAPVENPFFPGTKLAEIAEPMLFVLAVEDNSILQIGNNLIESNFKAAATPTYLVRMKDTGHWGVTDICGLVPAFDPGCGPGKRMTDGTDFTYLDPAQARTIAAAYAAAFFDLHLLDNAAALDYLQAAAPPDLVEVETRP